MSRRIAGTWIGIVMSAMLLVLPSCSSATQATGTGCSTGAGHPASSGPRAPLEDIQFANEWPSPNGDLDNTRVAHSTITSANVATLGVAWTIPLKGAGANGRDVANPVVANGVAYLQDGASNVTAVNYGTGKLLWSHLFNSLEYGPNGVTIANGNIYGVTATGVFALDSKTGRQLWYDTQLSSGKVSFNIPAQVGYGKVFVSSSLTVGGGIVYALDAKTGATRWCFQTVSDKIGQQLSSTAGGDWDAVLIGPDESVPSPTAWPTCPSSTDHGHSRARRRSSVRPSSYREPVSWSPLTLAPGSRFGQQSSIRCRLAGPPWQTI